MSERLTGLLRDRGARTFVLIWLSQTVSHFGAALTNFGLGVWVYERYGSVSLFAATMLSASLPAILLSPLAGMFVDRWDRRRTVIFCDCGRSLGTLTIAILLFTDKFEVWHLCAVLAVSASFSAFKTLASAAMVATLIPQAHFGRAAGLMQMGRPATKIIAPLVAAVLLGIVGIHGIVLIDFLTFFVPILTLLFLTVPQPEESAEGRAAKANVWTEFSSGWSFVREQPGVMGLLVYFATINFTMGLAQLLYRPLVLNFASVKAAGMMSSIGASAALFGSLLLTVWGGPKRKVNGILGFGLVYALGMMALGLRASEILAAAALFVLIFGIPIIRGCIRALWMTSTPADLQGRVFAAWNVVSRTAVILAYVIAGPLSDHVFEPLMAEGGALSDSVGLVIGVGPGRGIALLYLLLGSIALVATAVSFMNPLVRNLEDFPATRAAGVDREAGVEPLAPSAGVAK